MSGKILFNDLSRHTQRIMPELKIASERVLSSGWYILGSEGQKFEQEFAAFCNSEYAVGVANGSDALEIALRALGISAGQSVVTVANAGGYTTEALRSVGAVPAFVDVNLDTQLIDIVHLRELVATQPIAAVVVTHLFGRMADMPKIIEICDPLHIKVIEDCAQAHGAKVDGRIAGSYGAIGCFSFYPTKNLGALGDGGALVTSDALLVARIRSLRQYGWDTKYRVTLSGGRNSRLDEIQAAFLRVKLPYLEGWNNRRRAIANRYRTSIVNAKIQLPPEGKDDYVGHLFVMRCTDRESLRAQLQAAQIGCDVHYPIPDHQQPAWKDAYVSVSLPITEQLASEIISLPCYPELDDAEIETVIQAVNGW